MNCELLGLSFDSLFPHLAWTRNIQEKFSVKIPFPFPFIDEEGCGPRVLYGPPGRGFGWWRRGPRLQGSWTTRAGTNSAVSTPASVACKPDMKKTALRPSPSKR